MELEKNREKEIAEAALLRFVDDEELNESLLTYLDVRFIATEIVYLFQGVASIIFSIMASIVGAYVFYNLKQKPDDRIDKERLIGEISSILKIHNDQLDKGLRSIEEKLGDIDTRYRDAVNGVAGQKEKKFWQSRRSIRRQTEKEFVERDTARLESFREIVCRLKDTDTAAKQLIEIIEHEYTDEPENTKNFVNRFRKSPRRQL